MFAAADGGTTAYPGEATPEKAALTENDWRRFLDLTEQLGGATGVATLLQTWALTEDEAALLPARTDAREAYAALASVADGWAAPVGVRLAMDGWRFDAAGAGIEAATGVVERRDRVAELAAAQDLEPPTGAEAAYEAAADVNAIRARRGRGGVGGGVAPDAGERRDDRGGAAGLADRARAVGQDARRRSRAGAGLVGGRPL